MWGYRHSITIIPPESRGDRHKNRIAECLRYWGLFVSSQTKQSNQYEKKNN